jgi:hypothetical protein
MALTCHVTMGHVWEPITDGAEEHRFSTEEVDHVAVTKTLPMQVELPLVRPHYGAVIAPVFTFLIIISHHLDWFMIERNRRRSVNLTCEVEVHSGWRDDIRYLLFRGGQLRRRVGGDRHVICDVVVGSRVVYLKVSPAVMRTWLA